MDYLYDIGNVIIDVDFIPALQRLIPNDIENPNERINSLLKRKDEFEAGRIPPKTYFSWAAETIGFQGSQKDFLEAWLDIFTPNKPMWECIERLHTEGNRLILFSNINNPHKDYLLKTYPIFEKFVGGVFSYQTGHIKPEPQIYQLAIKEWRLDPGNTIYIDDLPANIKAGKNAGFICHLYDTQRHDTFLKWLDELQ